MAERFMMRFFALAFVPLGIAGVLVVESAAIPRETFKSATIILIVPLS